MRSLPLLALLLFTVVVLTAAPPSPQSQQGAITFMDELMADGGRRRFKAYNGWYLTDDGFDSLKLNHKFHVIPQHKKAEQQWTIERMNDNEVVIRGNTGYFIRHYLFNSADLVREANTWEMLTPVKNGDGTWSFKSRWNRWLSGGGQAEGRLDFQPENKKCEHWWLEPW